MARQAGSVYILVDADPSGFNKAMRSLSANARAQGNEVASNFGTAFAKPVNDAFTSLTRKFVTAKEALKWDDIRLPTDQVKELATQAGLSADRFADLAERITQNNAWEQAKNNLQSIAKSAGLTDKEIEALAKDLGFTEDQFKRFRTELARNEKQLKQVDTAANSFSSMVKKIAPAVISVAALRRGVDSVVTSLRDIVRTGDLAQSTGLLVEDFNRLSYYAGTAGISVEQFRSSWLNFQKSFNSSSGRDAFKQLNVNFKEIATLRPEQQLRAIADAFQNIDQSSRVTVAEKLFGKAGGREFIALLADGSEGLDKLADRFDKFGRQINQLDVERAKEAAIAIDNLKGAWGRLTDELAVRTAPVLEKIVSKLADGVSGGLFLLGDENKQIKEYTKNLEVANKQFLEAQQRVQYIQNLLDNPPNNADPDRWRERIEKNLKSAQDELRRFGEAVQDVYGVSQDAFNSLNTLTDPQIVIDIADTSGLEKQLQEGENLRRTLEDAIFSLENADDAVALISRDLDKFRAIAGDNSELQSLIDRLYELRVAALDVDEVLSEDQKFNTRLQFWRQYSDNALAANEDIMKYIEQQKEAFITAGIEEVDAARWASNEKLKYSTDWTAGAQRALQEYAKNATDIAQNIQSAIANAFNGAEDALVDFVTTGKLNFKDFADSIIADIARIAIRQAILGPLAGGLGGLFGTQHTGGIVGGETSFKMASPAVFANAPKFHTGGIVGGLRGLSSNEVPIIAQRGEGVFTPEQMKAMGSKSNVNVQVINNTPSQVSIKQQYNGNGDLNLTAVVDDAMAQNAARKGSNFNRTVAQSRQLTRR